MELTKFVKGSTQIDMELTERTQKSPTIKKHTTNDFSKMEKTFLTQIAVLQLNARVLFDVQLDFI